MSEKIVPLHGFGGGGAPLNFKVVGGTTRPAKANHNTIWIDTDKEITGYVLSATEPGNPVEGMVLIIISDSGSIKVASPVGAEWITVYPISAKQYVDGAWVDVEAKSYQNGEWVDWFRGILLYNEGDNFKDITGGWTHDAGYSTYTLATLTETGSGMRVTCKSDTHYFARVHPINKINLTGKTKLSAIIDITVAYSDMKLLADTTIAGKNIYTAQKNFTEGEAKAGQIDLDISGLGGEHYVGIQVLNNSSAKKASDVTIRKVWVE